MAQHRLQRVLLGGAALLAAVTGCSEGGDLSFWAAAGPSSADVGCHWVTYPLAPVWSCSAEQIETATNGAYPSAPPGPSGHGQVKLEHATCEDLADLRRRFLKADLHIKLARQRISLLKSNCLPGSESKYIDGAGNYCHQEYSDAGAEGPGHSAGGSGGGATEGADEYSTTNTQVDGVDEADFVKNDGQYVYVLSSDGLHVIDAWPPGDAHEVAKLSTRGEPRRLYLAGDRLVVYSRLGAWAAEAPSDSGCTYGYDCRFASEAGRVVIRIYDVAAPANPVMLRSFETSGEYVSSRRIGSVVHTAVHDRGVVGPDLDLALKASSPEALEVEFGEKLAKAKAVIDSLPATYFLPWVREVDALGNTLAEVASCDNALASEGANGASFTSVVSLEITQDVAPDQVVLATKPGYVFATASSLYLASDGADGKDGYVYDRSSPATDRSTIHKFGLNGLNVDYVGSTAIVGHVLNQFSMDEHDGVLRVATSSGWVPAPGVVSNVTTIGQGAEGLVVLGELSGLAPSEDIRAVRFDGLRAFIVTFKKTDPLFVIDMSEPSSPSVLGELKLPGFSTYMHPLDGNHLLALGLEAREEGDFAYFAGIQLQLFDVTQLAAPVLLHKTVIGTRGTASEALLNHLAFNYFPANSMLALPMTICEGGIGGSAGYLKFRGLMAFDVSLTTGVLERGRMPFIDVDHVDKDACDKWWSDSGSLVKRSIFMDDFVIGISDRMFKVAALDDMSNVLQSIALGDGEKTLPPTLQIPPPPHL